MIIYIDWDIPNIIAGALPVASPTTTNTITAANSRDTAPQQIPKNIPNLLVNISRAQDGWQYGRESRWSG